jgi:hypothetical protein
LLLGQPEKAPAAAQPLADMKIDGVGHGTRLFIYSAPPLGAASDGHRLSKACAARLKDMAPLDRARLREKGRRERE